MQVGSGTRINGSAEAFRKGLSDPYGDYVVSLINNFVATREQPQHKIISVRSQASIEEGVGPKGALDIIVLPRHFLAATVAVSIIVVVLCSTVVVASLAAWSMLR